MSESIERRIKDAVERELLLARLGGPAYGTFSRVVHSRANVVASPLAELSAEDEAKLKVFAERLVKKAIQDISSGKA